jgi:hypothetical protein
MQVIVIFFVAVVATFSELVDVVAGEGLALDEGIGDGDAVAIGLLEGLGEGEETAFSGSCVNLILTRGAE